MKPEWSQKASYGLEKKETYGGKHQLVPGICYYCKKASGGCCQGLSKPGTLTAWSPRRALSEGLWKCPYGNCHTTNTWTD